MVDAEGGGAKQRSQFFLHGFGNGEILTDRNSNRGSNILGKSSFQSCSQRAGSKTVHPLTVRRMKRNGDCYTIITGKTLLARKSA